MKANCAHNNRCRYTNGFYCDDCEIFFPKNSPTYRREEYPFTLILVIHDIRADCLRNGKAVPPEVRELMDRLEQAKRLSDAGLDMVLTDALVFIHSHGQTDESATVEIKVPGQPRATPA